MGEKIINRLSELLEKEEIDNKLMELMNKVSVNKEIIAVRKYILALLKKYKNIAGKEEDKELCPKIETLAQKESEKEYNFSSNKKYFIQQDFIDWFTKGFKYFQSKNQSQPISDEDKLLQILAWYNSKGDAYRERTLLVDCVKDFLKSKTK